MKVKNYSYETFPEYNENIEGIIDIIGQKEHLQCRLKDEYYKDGLRVRFLYPHTIIENNKTYPLVIHVQGSGWYKQDMNDHIFDFAPLVERGIVYAIVEYHESPKYHFPTQIIDTKNAIRYIASRLDAYKIDKNNVFLSGDSSGGHIALMTVFTYNTYLFDEGQIPLMTLKGVMDFYGVTNLETMNEWYSKYDHNEERNTIDFLGEINDELLKKASPVSYIDDLTSLPEMMIIHGSKDHVVPFTQSVELYKKLKEKNFNVHLVRVKNADHGRSIFYTKETYNIIEQFIMNAIM